MVQQLVNLLKEYYALYLKLHNYHWNVEGSNFKALHEMFESHYQQVEGTIDTVGELIRGLGDKVPAIVDIYTSSSIDHAYEDLTANQMIKDLIASHETMLTKLDETYKIAQALGDDVVMGFVVERLTEHRKILWMLKSSLS